jgi:hypothetical protein
MDWAKHGLAAGCHAFELYIDRPWLRLSMRCAGVPICWPDLAMGLIGLATSWADHGLGSAGSGLYCIRHGPG